MKLLIFGCGLLTVITTLLPLWRRDSWWIRSFDFPRLQITFIMAGLLLIHWIFFYDYSLVDFSFSIVLILCMLYQGSLMYPYTPLATQQVEQSQGQENSESISFLFANVQMENRKTKNLRKLIQDMDPDVLLTVETDQWWLDQLKDLKQIYPNYIEQPQDNCYGMALYSKLPLTQTEVKFLIEEDIPSIHSKLKLQSGQVIELRCLHPRPPFITGDETSSERDAELLVVGREIKDIDAPTVVLGDLNDVAWSRTNNLFQDISGLLDPRIGRGLFNTFHASYPFVRFPLDHSFHTHHFRLKDFQRLPYIGSDHFPVYIELNLEPSAKYKQEKLHADEQEKQETEEKIKKEVQE